MNVRPCPKCERLFDPDQSRALPFCSNRCRMADLNRWLDEGYGMPYQSPDEDENHQVDVPDEDEP